MLTNTDKDYSGNIPYSRILTYLFLMSIHSQGESITVNKATLGILPSVE